MITQDQCNICMNFDGSARVHSTKSGFLMFHQNYNKEVKCGGILFYSHICYKIYFKSYSLTTLYITTKSTFLYVFRINLLFFYLANITINFNIIFICAMEDSFTNWIVLDSGEGKPLRANG